MMKKIKKLMLVTTFFTWQTLKAAEEQPHLDPAITSPSAQKKMSRFKSMNAAILSQSDKTVSKIHCLEEGCGKSFISLGSLSKHLNSHRRQGSSQQAVLAQTVIHQPLKPFPEAQDFSFLYPQPSTAIQKWAQSFGVVYNPETGTFDDAF